jgi:bifunctional non-homologous end joining protein LigD
MSELLDGLHGPSRARLRRRGQPRRVEAMLATLTDRPFSDSAWIFERKLDGVRCLAFRTRNRVRLVSRNHRSMNATWPELVEALEHERLEDFIADGEIVAFEGNRTSFSRLQGRMGIHDAGEARRSGIAVHLYLFDLLHADGHDTTQLAQRERKVLLKRALSFGTRIRYTPHRNESGEKLLEDACRKGWEGLIAKDSRAPYVPGRSRKWLKLKCVNRQELVIGGFTDPGGSRQAFGALLVGYHEDGALRYAGKVGTGFDGETLERLGRRLRRLERESSPFAGDVQEKGAHFVRPRLVGEFGFTEWTRGGKLRHPRFLGLRTDKDLEEVRRERPGA